MVSIVLWPVNVRVFVSDIWIDFIWFHSLFFIEFSRELAEIIRNQRVVGVNDDDIELVHYDSFRKDWVARFMSRYPQLASARRKLIEAAWIKGVSAEQLTKWFEDLQSIINEYNIEPGNMYNMDESGFAIGDIEA